MRRSRAFAPLVRRVRAKRSTKSSRPIFLRHAPIQGEHVVEISAHGSPVVLQAIVGSAIEAGARLAEPGEFTLRAFLNGKRDLIQAEGGRRSDCRGNAAAGAGRVRSTRGDAHPAHRCDRCRAVRSDRAARGVARFSRRGVPLHRAGGNGSPRRLRRCAAGSVARRCAAAGG